MLRIHRSNKVLIRKLPLVILVLKETTAKVLGRSMPRKTTKERKTTKKVTRRRRKTPPPIQNGLVVDVEQVYKIINRIQLTGETADFIVQDMDMYVAENVLKDAGLTFVKTSMKTKGDILCKHFKVDPPKVVERRKEDFNDFEEFPDEIIEDGQIFF